MAEARISTDQFSVDNFSCPVCLDLLKDPVTINCGHSFCMLCINCHWDQEQQSGVYSCPQCRDTFTPRPVLRRNTMLAEVVEKLKKATFQTTSVGPDVVDCDFCTGKQHKAVKSCLVCLTSLCETHLEPHLKLPALRKHRLIEVSSKLQEKLCSQHDEVLKIYCRTDQRCICSLCLLDNHKDHKTVSVTSERIEKQKELDQKHREIQQRIMRKQKKVQELKQAVINIQHNAQAAVENSEIIFTELISCMEKKRLEVVGLIRDQEKVELSRAQEILDKLEEEIVDLKKRTNELKQLSQTQDHVCFLKNFQSILCVPVVREDSVSITVNQHFSFDRVKESLSYLKNQISEFCTEEFSKNLGHDYLYLTLDPNTSHPHLSLSEDNRVVTHSLRQQSNADPNADHPDRFDHWRQVLCHESVHGRCYWEVELSRDDNLEISVCYKSISRKTDAKEGKFGYNSQSWSLQCSSSPYFWHNNNKTEVQGPLSSRIGVYVDHGAGTLSFYSISESYRVQTMFTQPLYAGFGLVRRIGAIFAPTVKLCDPRCSSGFM
ncbi:tripartite motif-containing protein 16-like [Trichomycterus rosablanca]|uniref:tripartite motif-containing protein 16-like n=1 Tax=Trichomycterus rosablanca TaxID=2290929 RepID=UPI002F3568CF